MNMATTEKSRPQDPELVDKPGAAHVDTLSLY
jgi:hypothetical protein